MSATCQYTYPQVLCASHVSVHLPTGTVCQSHVSTPTHRYCVPATCQYTYPQVMYASHVSVHLPTGTVCQPHASAPTHRYHVPPGDWLTEALCIIITTSDEILNLIQFMYMLVNSHWSQYESLVMAGRASGQN